MNEAGSLIWTPTHDSHVDSQVPGLLLPALQNGALGLHAPEEI